MSTTELAPVQIGEDIERVLLGGDLASLTPDQRLKFYNAICRSLGLNPLTKPFAYIQLNSKLQLYALKDCTEQLRKIHGVSITNVDPKQIGDLLVVVASAKDKDGRIDSSTGAVAVTGLAGEALANAMMKCETKAKRRVTLSLCGLGMLDETEIETLKAQGVAQEAPGVNKWEPAQLPQTLSEELEAAEPFEPSKPTVQPINGKPSAIGGARISDRQAALIYAVGVKNQGKPALMKWLGDRGHERTDDILVSQFEEAKKWAGVEDKRR